MEIKSGFLLERPYYIVTCTSLSDLILYVPVRYWPGKRKILLSRSRRLNYR